MLLRYKFNEQIIYLYLVSFLGRKYIVIVNNASNNTNKRDHHFILNSKNKYIHISKVHFLTFSFRIFVQVLNTLKRELMKCSLDIDFFIVLKFVKLINI